VDRRCSKSFPTPLSFVGIVIVLAVALLIEPIDGDGTVIGGGAGLVSSLAYAFFWRVSRKLEPAMSPATMSCLQNFANRRVSWVAPLGPPDWSARAPACRSGPLSQALPDPSGSLADAQRLDLALRLLGSKKPAGGKWDSATEGSEL
jgi:hypothetical protein